MAVFKYRGPLSPDSFLFRGRAHELALLNKHCTGDIESYPMLYAGRMTGKTSLLLRLISQLPTTTLACRVDFQRAGMLDIPSMCRFIARRLKTTASDNRASEAATALSRHELRQKLADHFNLSELAGLSFDLGIDFENLAGSNKDDKARELILYCERHSCINELIGRCRELRPNADWFTSDGEMSRFVTDDILTPDELTDAIIAITRQQHVSRLVLAIEEPGALQSEAWHALANTLRAMFNSRFERPTRALSKLCVILSGSIDLYELSASDVSPLHNVVERIHLPDLSADESIGLIRDGLMQYGVDKTQADKYGQAIHEMVDGHPYLCQRLGGALESQLEQERHISVEIIEHCAKQLIEEDALFQYMFQRLSDHNLWPTVRSLLEASPRGSANQKLQKLKWLGVAKDNNGAWFVRNSLFKQALAQGLEQFY